jgi:hypothetical protein
MTLPNRRLSLEEVLDQFFFSADTPSPDMVLRACEAHPEYREDILELAALWSSYEASPEPTLTKEVTHVSEESVSRLQSFVLNRVHELDLASPSHADVEAARLAVEQLAGGKLRRAAAASGLGESVLLLTKVLTKGISDIPPKVLVALAGHLKVATRGLEQCVGSSLSGARSFKASRAPDTPSVETWESAVRSLPVNDEEKRRLVTLQAKEDAS